MSLFNPQDNQTIIARIQALTPDSPRQWGKMDAAQMLAHCIQPMKIAFREVKSRRGLIGMLFGAMARRKYIFQDKPFEQNLPTDPTFVRSNPEDFAKQQSLLISYVQRWVKDGPNAITSDPHPFFGKINSDNWDTLMSKHLDHHLRQFGV